MDEPILPSRPGDLAEQLVSLRLARREHQEARRRNQARRRQLTQGERAAVLARTAARCHICGGRIDDHWQADHVLAFSRGGGHAAENYLPAHALCNAYRWDYSPEEFQWVLKIGVWARRQMEKQSPLGLAMLSTFFDYEVRRQKRRAAADPPEKLRAAEP